MIETLEERRLLSCDGAGGSYETSGAWNTGVQDVGGDLFGQSIAANANYIAVGAPGADDGVAVDSGLVYLISRSTNDIVAVIHNPDPEGERGNDAFGSAVAFLGDDLLVGAPGDNLGLGQAYRISTGGNLLATFEPAAGAASRGFGLNVAAYGSQALIASGFFTGGLETGITTGVVSLHDGNGEWVRDLVKTAISSEADNFGISMAVDGSRILVGAPSTSLDVFQSGAAYLYSDANSIPETVSLAPEAQVFGAAFGSSVAFYNGNPVVSAAPVFGRGHIYLFDGQGGVTSIDDPQTNPDLDGERFGYSIAVSGDTLAVGAVGAFAEVTVFAEDPDTGEVGPITFPFPVGKVYVYDLPTQTLTQELVDPKAVESLANPSLGANAIGDNFGTHVLFAGSELIASAPAQFGFGRNGDVYAFEAAGGSTPPAVSAGDDQSVNENAEFTLTATGTEGGSYAWDLDNDGIFETSGQSVTLSRDLPGNYTFAVQVTSDCGVASDSVTVAVADVDPVAAPVSFSSVRNMPIALAGAGSSSTDALVSYAWDTDADGIFDDAATFSSGVTGTFILSYKVIDDDGDFAVGSATVVVTGSLVDAQGRLFIGTSPTLASRVSVTQSLLGVTTITVDGTRISTPAGLSQILVFGGSGDDFFSADNTDTPVYFNGGAGDDKLKGSVGGDVLIGGDGDDKIGGASGRDIIIGGRGADKIHGSSEEDILIGGRTIYDEDPAAMAAIRQIWLGAGDFATRRDALRDPSAAVRLVANETVFDDGIGDLVHGDGGPDWYFVRLSGDGADKTDFDPLQAFAGDLDLLSIL